MAVARLSFRAPADTRPAEAPTAPPPTAEARPGPAWRQPAGAQRRRREHKERVALALSRRVGGDGGEVTAERLADLCGCSRQEVRNWMHARHDPGSWFMGELIKFFGPAFMAEVYGDLGAVRWRRREAAGAGGADERIRPPLDPARAVQAARR